MPFTTIPTELIDKFDDIVNGAKSRCEIEAGYNRPLTSDEKQGITQLLGISTANFGIESDEEARIAGLHNGPVEESLPAPEPSEAEYAIMTRCGDAVNAALTAPELQLRATGAEMVNSASDALSRGTQDTSRTVRKQLVSCVTEAGWTPADTFKPYDGESDYGSYFGVAVGSQTQTDRALVYHPKERESELAVSFARCRRQLGTNAALLAAARSVESEYVKQHAAEIEDYRTKMSVVIERLQRTLGT